MAGDTECEFCITLKSEKPSIRKIFDRFAEVVEGEKLELNCSLDGSPIPHVQWYKDGQKILEDEQYVDLKIITFSWQIIIIIIIYVFLSVKIKEDANGNVSLLIEHVKPTDGGAYKMVATNPSGEESSLCAVAIMRKFL